jgi:hypothetical protein
MAVVAIKSKKDGKAGGWTLDKGLQLTATVRVHMDSAATGPQAILRSLGLNVGDAYRYPLTGTPTETNASLFVQDIQIGATSANGLLCDVNVTFGPQDPAKDDRGPVDPETGLRDPFAAPVKLRWTTEFEDYAPEMDKAGNPILNKAGDPFSTPIVIPYPTSVAIVSRVEREYDETWLSNFKGRVNSAEWLGWPAGSVLCQDINGDREWNDDIQGWTWPTEYKFAFRPPIVVSSKKVYPGWSVQVLNAGLREKVSGVKRPIIIKGAQVSEPWLLDSSGVAYPEDSTAEPVYLTFDIYPEADFDALGLPADLFTVGTPGV